MIDGCIGGRADGEYHIIPEECHHEQTRTMEPRLKLYINKHTEIKYQ